MSVRGHRLAAAAALVVVPLLAGCGSTGSAQGPAAPSSGPSHAVPSTALPGATGSTDGAAVPAAAVSMPPPGRLDRPMLSADVLVYSSRTLTPQVRRRIGAVNGVVATEPFAMAQFNYHENAVTYGAVDPASFRRYTLAGTGQTTAVWDRVAGGEIAIDPALGKRLQDARGYVQMGGGQGSPLVHVGAYAQLFDPRLSTMPLSAVVNQRWVSRLGMVPDNALLVSTGAATPSEVVKRIKPITGRTASVQILGPNFDVHAVQTAVLTGQSVSSAVGTYNYTANADGTVNPDPGWVADYIRTEDVPILGRVTCNKEMLPQLVDALTEIRQRGLADQIHPGQYGGCFVPRYIAGTHTLSNHAFGLAIDLNVPENQRGTRGRMNPQVVDIFAKWGFAWGGTWHYTDPMHFELTRLVRAG
jgi:hypothetical protein